MQNTRSTISAGIASYYMQARGIPQENRLSINCSTDEIVSKTECETNIIAPIRAYLQDPENSGIDYIVLTKGVPLGANYGYSTGPISVTSILTCVTETGVTGPITNPYGPTAWPVVDTAFSHQLTLGGKHLYLVTRLDGYTVQDIYGLIDRSMAATRNGTALIDARVVSSPPSFVTMNDRLLAACPILTSRGVTTTCDSTNNFMGGASGLIAYFSWGSNDPYYNHAAYASNTFVPGSIADTYVSTSGRTFNPTTGGQSLIADLIPLGACGLAGYVSEPYANFTTYPNVLFDRYTRGYNMAESFYAACPEIFWKMVAIGDPLMAPFANPPNVSVEQPQAPLTGVATVSATASDPSGVSKVEFYFEGQHIGTATQAPYMATVDTTQYTVGPHTVEAVAFENSPAAPQGFASAVVTVQNTISNLSVIADAFGSPDGQGVRATDVVVSAGTAEMGGGDFYVQEADRASAMRIISTEEVIAGDVVTLEGPLVTDSGERCVFAPTITNRRTPSAQPNPMVMPNRSLGGSDVSIYTGGVTDGSGARNLSLLVKTLGKVTYIGMGSEQFFYIDDGSRLDDGSGHSGLKVNSRTLLKPALNKWVAVTGLSSCEEVGGRVIRALKPRRQSDVQPLTQ
ncbi:MAG: TIGR03790 family protein [Armatimonadota bacterium]|nr:TIGR03790 family protein [Armatimonadota bacterium]